MSCHYPLISIHGVNSVQSIFFQRYAPGMRNVIKTLSFDAAQEKYSHSHLTPLVVFLSPTPLSPKVSTHAQMDPTPPSPLSSNLRWQCVVSAAAACAAAVCEVAVCAVAAHAVETHEVATHEASAACEAGYHRKCKPQSSHQKCKLHFQILDER
jgi:hypothetical protein